MKTERQNLMTDNEQPFISDIGRELAATRERLNGEIARGFKLATEAQSFHEEAEDAKRKLNDAAMLIRRLCRCINQESQTRRQALDWLLRNNLGGSPLKEYET